TKLPHWKEALDVLTEESEYWIGFLFADGSINYTKIGSPILDVGLAEVDVGHLEKLRFRFRSQHKIIRVLHENVKFGERIVAPKWGARYSLRSWPLVRALEKYGMAKKSLERAVSFEPLLSSRHFWRG